MCQWGNTFCDFEREKSILANALLTHLFESAEWKRKIPDGLIREFVLEGVVREKLNVGLNQEIPFLLSNER